MKTDRFSDIIRRKLESIRPEFSEKDWTRMQSTLQNANLPQPGSPGAGQPVSSSIWSSHPWLMAAATISTAVLVAVGIWQRREINQLRQTVGQLTKQQVAQATQKPAEQHLPDDGRAPHTDGPGSKKTGELSATSGKIDRQSVRPDTVYINRYVAVPSTARSSSEVANANPSTQRIESPAQERYVKTSEKTAPANGVRQSVNQPSTQKSTQYDITSPSPEVPNINPSVASSEPATSVDSKAATPDHIKPDGTNAERLLSGRQSQKGQGSGVSNERSRDTKNSTSYSTNAAENTSNGIARTTPIQTEPTADASGSLAKYELATARPLSTQSINWNALLAQRSRRMPSARVTPVAPTAAPATDPASQPVQRLTSRFRAGLGGELASHLWSAGVFTEVLIGKRLSVGVGLTQATYNGTFINDYDFDVRTRRDFRKEFARFVDPRRDILNINAQTVRLQIPISLGYRIPLTQTVSLLPTLGTSLNITSSENVTYYCPVFIPKKWGFDEFSLSDSGRPVALINNLALGTGLEWQSRHWVVQTSPVLTLPMQADKDPNWQNSITLGLRARVLFQF